MNEKTEPKVDFCAKRDDKWNQSQKLIESKKWLNEDL